MSHPIKTLPHSHVQFEIVFDDAIMAAWEPKALKKLSAETKIAGFRPGKVPAEMLKKHYGKAYLTAYTIDFAFPSVYTEFVKKHELKVVARPDVKETKKTPPSFDINVAVYPEVKVGNYKKIKIAKEEIKVTKADIEKVVTNIKQHQAEYKDVDRAAKIGDKVEVSFEGFDKDGTSLRNTASKSHPLILGEKNFIPGFEENIVGMKVAEKKEFDLTFPKDYHAADFKGKKVTFKVTLEKVIEIIFPEITEEFIKKVTGKEQTPAEFEKEIEKQLQIEKEREQKVKRENELIDEIIKLTTTDLPDEMLQEETHMMLDDLKRHIAKQQIPWDGYLAHRKLTEEALREESKPEAEKRLKARLAFEHILNEEKINVPDERVKKEIETIKSYYPGQKDQIKKIEKAYKEGSQMREELKRRLQMEILMEGMLG